MVKPLYSKHAYHALPVLPCIYLSNIFRPGCLYQVYHYSAVQWLPLMHPLSKITTFRMHTVNINSEALLIKETVNIWFVKVQLLKKKYVFLKNCYSVCHVSAWIQWYLLTMKLWWNGEYFPTLPQRDSRPSVYLFIKKQIKKKLSTHLC